MSNEQIPIIVLGGSDRRHVELPDSGRDKHPLSGCKGVDVLFNGRPLVETVVRRLEETGCFEPIHIAGPAQIYERIRTSARVIDTDGGFGDNIRVSLEAVRKAHPGRPVAFITCDVLPEAGTLRKLMGEYRKHAPCDMWIPLIRAPRDRSQLGEFAWKPAYRISPQEGRPAVPILPGHWIVIDPEALRLRFMYRLFQIGYNTRNRPIDSRRRVMVRSLLLELLLQDLLHLVGGRPPTLTWSVLGAGIPAAKALRDGTITRRRLEDDLRRIFVRYRHRRSHPERRVHVPLVEGLSLALDIDTEEEARQLGGDFSAASS